MHFSRLFPHGADECLMIYVTFCNKSNKILQNITIVTKCKYEFKIASNPCIIAHRIE